MFCPKCGTENEDEARFCKECGTQLPQASGAVSPVGPPTSVGGDSHRLGDTEQETALVCPECSRENTAGASYCQSCGTRLQRRVPFARWKGVLAGAVGLAMVVAALILGVFVVGRDGGEKAGIVGTYYNQANPEEYLELNVDGTFYLKEMGIGFTGEWTVEGDVITLSFPAGFAARGHITGNTITDEEGKIWVKRGASGATSKTRTDIVGMFVREDDPDEYIELRENGTFNARAPTGERYPGTWTADGNTITLTFTAGESVKAEIKENTLVLEGVIYVKERR